MKTVDFRRLPLASGDIVLDLGCGEGRHVISAYVEANVHSIGVDLSLDDLKTTRERFASFDEPDNAAKSFGLSSASALNLPFAESRSASTQPAEPAPTMMKSKVLFKIPHQPLENFITA